MWETPLMKCLEKDADLSHLGNEGGLCKRTAEKPVFQSVELLPEDYRLTTQTLAATHIF